MSSFNKNKKLVNDYKQNIHNFEKRNHNILINTLPQETPIVLKKPFMKVNNSGKVGLELFTTFRRSDSVKVLDINISKPQIINVRSRNQSKEYVDRRHFETQEKIYKMKKDLYSVSFKPSLSANTIKICEKLSFGEKIDFNKFYQNGKSLTRNNTKESLNNNFLKLSTHSSFKKNEKKQQSNSENLDCLKMNHNNSKYLLQSLNEKNTRRSDNGKSKLTYSNSVSKISTSSPSKRISELNSFKDHLTRIEVTNQKENENKAILRDIALFKKGKNSRLGNISPMIINEINTKTKFKKSVEN